jgi:uncharacterized protein (DUF952 family)
MNLAYKIVDRTLWEARFRVFQKFVDGENGIHMSQKHQLKATLKRKYQGVPGLCLVCVDLEKVTGNLVWTKTYPRLFGAIIPQSVVWVSDIRWTTNGRFIQPLEFY